MQVIKNTLVSWSFSAQLLLNPNCKPQTLEWHVQPLDSAATDPTGPATLQSGFDWCFQHVQTNSLNQTSNQTAQKPVPNASSRQLLEQFLAYLHDGTFAVYTGASWKAFALPAFAARPAAHSGRLSVSNLQLNNSTPALFMSEPPDSYSAVCWFCSVCLPDVAFWSGACSRNNAVTCKNRKLTKSHQLPQTSPVQSYHSSHTAALFQLNSERKSG